MANSDYLEQLIKNLPEKPGVYLMKDISGKVIYVGKAKILKNRVRQYFRGNIEDPKVKAMVSHVYEFEYLITDNEMEALILENNLIKEYKPQYNILLKDDKTYPYIKVTKEAYPKIVKTRKVLKDGALYFGPYVNAFAINEFIVAINDVFLIRECNRNIEASIKRKERPCLNFYIKRCLGPCTGNVNNEDYQKELHGAIEVLKGNSATVTKYIQEKMIKASKELNFEEAAKYRDQIASLDNIAEKQKLVVNDAFSNQDYVVYSNDERKMIVTIFFMRNGKISGQESFDFDLVDDPKTAYNSFIIQYYFLSESIPEEIILEESIEDISLLENYLSNKKGKKVKMSVPQKGQKKDMIALAKNNAHEQFKQKAIKELEKNAKSTIGLKEIKEILGLEGINVIEAYDISNIKGTNAVGVKIVYRNGKKSPKEYRRYRIKTLDDKSDDYASMAEVIERRLKDEVLPDLILLDGGKGHVSTIKKVLQDKNINIPVFGMYKDDSHKTQGLCSDAEVYDLPKRTQGYKLVFEMQEEVHRFAIDYHRSIRDKNMIKSELDDIPGIGEKRKTVIFNHYKSVDNLRQADAQEIAKLPGFNKGVAQKIIDYFKEKNSEIID